MSAGHPNHRIHNALPSHYTRGSARWAGTCRACHQQHARYTRRNSAATDSTRHQQHRLRHQHGAPKCAAD